MRLMLGVQSHHLHEAPTRWAVDSADGSELATQIAVNVIVGVIVGCIFYRLDNNEKPERALRDRTGCIFFCIINFMFGNLGGIEMFLQERLIFMHEKASGYYHTSSYYVSKLLCDMIPVRVVPTIVFATTVYFMAGLQVLRFHSVFVLLP